MSTVFHGNLDLEQWLELSIFLCFFPQLQKPLHPQRSYVFSPTKGTELTNKYRLEITPSHGNLFIFLTIKYSNATYTSSALCSPFYIGAFITYIYIHIDSYLPISASPPPPPPHQKKGRRKSNATCFTLLCGLFLSFINCPKAVCCSLLCLDNLSIVFIYNFLWTCCVLRTHVISCQESVLS